MGSHPSPLAAEHPIIMTESATSTHHSCRWASLAAGLMRMCAVQKRPTSFGEAVRPALGLWMVFKACNITQILWLCIAHSSLVLSDFLTKIIRFARCKHASNVFS